MDDDINQEIQIIEDKINHRGVRKFDDKFNDLVQHKTPYLMV